MINATLLNRVMTSLREANHALGKVAQDPSVKNILDAKQTIALTESNSAVVKAAKKMDEELIDIFA